MVADGRATATFLPTSGRLPVQTIYTILIGADLHTLAAERAPVLTHAASLQSARPAAPIPVAVFCAPGALNTSGPVHASNRSDR